MNTFEAIEDKSPLNYTEVLNPSESRLHTFTGIISAVIAGRGNPFPPYPFILSVTTISLGISVMDVIAKITRGGALNEFAL